MSPGCADAEISLYLNPLASSPHYLTLKAEHGLGFDRSCAVHNNVRRIITNNQPSHRISIAVFACADHGVRGTFTAILARDGKAIATQELDVLVIPPELNFAGVASENCLLDLIYIRGDDDGRTGDGMAHYGRAMIYSGYEPFLTTLGLGKAKVSNCAVGVLEGTSSRQPDDRVISLSGELRVTGWGLTSTESTWRFGNTCERRFISGVCRAFVDGPVFELPDSDIHFTISGVHSITVGTHSTTLNTAASDIK